MARSHQPTYALELDEDGMHTTKLYDSRKNALWAWARACRRSTCYSARLYRESDQERELLAHHRQG